MCTYIGASTTSLRCEASTDDYGKAVIISDYTHPVARITPYYKSVQAVAAPLDPEAAATSIPSKATSLSGMRELAAHPDDATAHVIAAAAAAQRDRPSTHTTAPHTGRFFHTRKTITILNIRGRDPHTTGGVPENDTPEASPHASPIAPTRANGT